MKIRLLCTVVTQISNFYRKDCIETTSVNEQVLKPILQNEVYVNSS